MEPFTTLTAHAVPFLEDDVDTDAIFPARFLLIMEKAGLGRYLFHDRRHPVAGDTAPFVLDLPRYAGAAILIAGANFGCGSSREQAVWTLVGAGFRCVIAPSFGDIFYANAFKNGLLPIVLPESVTTELGRMAEAGAPFTIDLVQQRVRAGSGPDAAFAIAADRREALLQGWDDIDEILQRAPLIAAFETQSRRVQPWLFAADPALPSRDGHAS